MLHDSGWQVQWELESVHLTKGKRTIVIDTNAYDPGPLPDFDVVDVPYLGALLLNAAMLCCRIMATVPNSFDSASFDFDVSENSAFTAWR